MSAKDAVLAEMNRRLAADSDSAPHGSTSVSADFSFISAIGTKRSRDDDEDDSNRSPSGSILSSKFDKAHQKQFEK